MRRLVSLLLVLAFAGGTAADIGPGGASLRAQTRPAPRRAPVTRQRNPAARRGFSIEILEPRDNAIAIGSMRIVAAVAAADASQVLEVTFYVDGEKIFVDQEAPYQTLHDFGDQPRSVVVRAVATHNAGYSVERSIVTRALRLSYAVEVRRVLLTLSVVDADGRPVIGLDRDDFRVHEDGVEQEIIEFLVEERPLRIAVVLDTSGSMRESLPQVQLAASDFLAVLGPEDRAMVIDFDDQVFLLQELTASRENLRAALMSTYARGGTAMYDAVHATLRRLSGNTQRKAIVLLSDGGDSASVLDQDRVLEAARSADVLVYAIGLGKADTSVLKTLTRETGGRAFFADRKDDLGAVYQRIADELRNQYVLTYSSTNPSYDGKFRRIEVDHVGKGNVRVVTRRGYYAVRPVERPLEAPLPVSPEVPADSAEEEGAPAAGSASPSPPAPPDSPPAGPAPPEAAPDR